MCCYIGVLLRFILEKLLDVVHMWEFMSIVTVDVVQFTGTVSLQLSSLSWLIRFLGFLGWWVSTIVVRRVRLFATSLWLVVTPVPSVVFITFPLLVIGGWLVGKILLRKNLTH